MEKLPLILLVDDEPADNYAHERLLHELGVAVEIHAVTSGQVAIDLLSRDPPLKPTLLLLDVNLPDLDGFEFVAAFQQLPALQRDATHIILLTGGMRSEDLGRLYSLPVAGLVIKPLTRDKIDELLQQHFQRRLPEA